jgi:hypothetical protein
MIDKRHVESVLRINGLTKTAADEEIRSVLLSARFEKDEIETALMVLRENVKTSETRVDGLHKVFRSDQVLQPEEISELLGVDVALPTITEQKVVQRKYAFLQFLSLWTASLVIAVTTVLVYMYIHNIGFFHPTNSVFEI